MTIEHNAVACNRLMQLVRDFALRTKGWETAIRYETRADERRDLTLASQRVYQRRDEFLVIAAAAGLSTFDEPLEEQVLTLPTEEQLKQLKLRAGYENNPQKRARLKQGLKI